MAEASTFQAIVSDIAGQIGMMWEVLKAPLLAPLLRVAVYICLVMELMLFTGRLYTGIVIILAKLFLKKPDNRYKWEPMSDDLEIGNAAFPKVLAQTPMFKAREVYKISVGAACNLSSDRLVTQVLDDSTDPIIKDLVETECLRWAVPVGSLKYYVVLTHQSLWCADTIALEQTLRLNRYYTRTDATFEQILHFGQ